MGEGVVEPTDYHKQVSNVHSGTGIRDGRVQPVPICLEGWVVSTSQPGQMDPVITGEGLFRRISGGRDCSKELL